MSELQGLVLGYEGLHPASRMARTRTCPAGHVEEGRMRAARTRRSCCIADAYRCIDPCRRSGLWAVASLQGGWAGHACTARRLGVGTHGVWRFLRHRTFAVPFCIAECREANLCCICAICYPSFPTARMGRYTCQCNVR